MIGREGGYGLERRGGGRVSAPSLGERRPVREPGPRGFWLAARGSLAPSEPVTLVLWLKPLLTVSNLQKTEPQSKFCPAGFSPIRSVFSSRK